MNSKVASSKVPKQPPKYTEKPYLKEEEEKNTIWPNKEKVADEESRCPYQPKYLQTMSSHSLPRLRCFPAVSSYLHFMKHLMFETLVVIY